MAQPTTPITNPAFEYRNAAATDVTQTWRRFGWKAKGEAQAKMQVAIAPDGTRVEYREVMRIGAPAAGSGFNFWGKP